MTGPAFRKLDLAAAAPLTEAFLFMQTVTGLVELDLYRSPTGEVVGVVARGKRGLDIRLRIYQEESHG